MGAHSFMFIYFYLKEVGYMQIVFLIVFLGLVVWLIFSVERNRKRRIEDQTILEKIKSTLSNDLAFGLMKDKPTITYQDLVSFCAKNALVHNVDIDILAFKKKFSVLIKYRNHEARINISASAVTGFTGEPLSDDCSH